MSDENKATYREILTRPLAEYATTLLAEGFRVYVFTSDVRRMENGGRPHVAQHFAFSRTVNGKECWGNVSGRWGGYSFSMPIKPSREHGSGMFIGGKEVNEWDELTVENAELYASPTGRNFLVGTQENYGPAAYGDLYTEVKG